MLTYNSFFNFQINFALIQIFVIDVEKSLMNFDCTYYGVASACCNTSFYVFLRKGVACELDVEMTQKTFRQEMMFVEKHGV